MGCKSAVRSRWGNTETVLSFAAGHGFMYPGNDKFALNYLQRLEQDAKLAQSRRLEASSERSTGPLQQRRLSSLSHLRKSAHHGLHHQITHLGALNASLQGAEPTRFSSPSRSPRNATESVSSNGGSVVVVNGGLHYLHVFPIRAYEGTQAKLGILLGDYQKRAEESLKHLRARVGPSGLVVYKTVNNVCESRYMGDYAEAVERIRRASRERAV